MVCPSSLIESAFRNPTFWEYLGNNKYLQMAVSKAEATTYVTKFGAVTSKRLSKYAAKAGFLPLLAWAGDMDCDWDEELFIQGIEGGHIAILLFLLENDCPLPAGTQAFEAAAKARNLQTLGLLYYYAFPWDTFTCCAAAEVNWLEGLQYLRARGCPWGKSTLKASAWGGHLEVLKYAHYNGCPDILQDAVFDAAYNGQLEVMKWLMEEGCVFDSKICAVVAFHGNLPALQWLRANNVPWDAQVVRRARAMGHTDVERWAIENGCPEL